MTLLLSMLLLAGPVKLAAPGASCVGVEKALCDAWLEHFQSILAGDGRVQVTSARDIEQLLGMERQRQLLGCEASSCMAELVGALGVDGLLVSSIARSGAGYVVTIKVLRSRDGKTWVQATGTPDSDGALQGWLEARAREFADTLAPPPPASPLARWTPGLVGGACALAGAGLFAWSKVDAATLKDTGNGASASDLATAASRGKMTQPVGLALLGVGAAGLAVSLAWSVVAASAAPVAVVPTAGGAALVLGGAF